MLRSLVAVLALASTGVHAEPDRFGLGTGRSGAAVISTPTVVNRYAQLTLDAPRGATRLSLDVATGFQAGQLVMVHQTTLAGTPPPPGVEGRVDLRRAGVGRWELARVSAVESNQLVLTAPLERGFPGLSSQVVFVPEYTSLQVQFAQGIIAADWDGRVGGIVALLVQGTLDNEGAISASGAGFRGGLSVLDGSSMFGCDLRDQAPPLGGMKGEGLVAGRYGTGGWGAAFSGGGGGSCHNGGGGGGSNGAPGGRGGLPTGTAPQVLAPGGEGGVAHELDPLLHLVFGGGGGAGGANNAADTAGARGGGVVFVRAGIAVGVNGKYTANGGTAGVSVDDGAGGGGAGGSILVRAGSFTCSSVEAAGGNGGVAADGRLAGGGGGASGRVFVQGTSTGACSVSSARGACGSPQLPDGGREGRGCEDGAGRLATWQMDAYDPAAPPQPDPYAEPGDGGTQQPLPDGGSAVPPRFVSSPNGVAFCGAPYRYASTRRPEVIGDQPLQFSLRGAAPEGLVVDAMTGELTWKPSGAQGGVHTFELVVSGPGGEAAQDVEIAVECPGSAPMKVGCGCGVTGGGAWLLLLALAALGRRPPHPS